MKKPLWPLVDHVGITGHDRMLVSRAVCHFITGVIKSGQTLSMGIVNVSMPLVDIYGSQNGA